VWINLAVIVLLACLVLGIANMLVAATAQRRVEMTALRLHGTTRPSDTGDDAPRGRSDRRRRAR
jgi:hypothetical protein